MRETLVKSEEFKDSPLGEIPKDWEVVNLGSVLTVLYRYPTYYGIQYVETGVPEVRGELILDDGYLDNRLALYRYISESTASRFHKVRLEPGDFVLSVRGTMGKVAMVATELKGAVITANLIRLQFNHSLVSPQWARHFLLSNIFQDQLDLETSATTIKTIQAPALSSMLLRLPSFQEQEHIAEILDTIDSTIAHTSSLIAKLKQMKAGLLHDLLTQGLDENGELRDAIGHPEQFKDSPLGRIPKDWEVVKLVDHISLPNGQLDPKQQPYCNWVLIAPDHIESETGRILNLQTAAEQNAISGKYGFQLGDVLYSKIRPYLRKAVLADREGLCSADMYPLRPEPTIVSRFLLALILGEDFSRFATAVSMRSGFPKINREELSEYQLALPTYKEQQRIAEILDTYDTRIRTEEAYRDKLKLQKQGLMHDLLTGKVRVKNTDKLTSVGDTS